MKSTNMLERYSEEIKRRTRVVRIFPHAKSCVRLVSTLAMEENEAWLSRRYLNMESVEMHHSDLMSPVCLMNNSEQFHNPVLSP